MHIPVRITPNAAALSVGGTYNPRAEAEPPRLIVRVTAPPEVGRANRAVLKQMAKALGVPKSSLSIEKGERGRDERLAVQDPPEGLPARVAGLLRAHAAKR